MAPAIKQASAYLKVILDPATKPQQAKLLLGTANPVQLRAITEIFVNIIDLDTTTRPNLKRTLKRNVKVIHILSSTTTPWKHKINAIRRKLQVVYSLILLMKDAILKILSS